MRKLFSAALIGVLGTIGLMSSPASASLGECPDGRLCLYDGVNYETLIWSATPGAILATSSDCIILPASANNRASSVYNRAGLVNTTLTLWDAGPQGNRGIGTTGYQDANMLTSPGISSFSNVTTYVCATVN